MIGLLVVLGVIRLDGMIIHPSSRIVKAIHMFVVVPRVICLDTGARSQFIDHLPSGPMNEYHLTITVTVQDTCQEWYQRIILL